MAGFREWLRKLSPTRSRSSSRSSPKPRSSRGRTSAIAEDHDNSSSTQPSVDDTHRPLSPSTTRGVTIAAPVDHHDQTGLSSPHRVGSPSAQTHSEHDSPSSPHTHKLPSKSEVVQNTLTTALRVGSSAAEVFPPAAAAVGAVMEILGIIDVSELSVYCGRMFDDVH